MAGLRGIRHEGQLWWAPPWHYLWKGRSGWPPMALFMEGPLRLAPEGIIHGGQLGLPSHAIMFKEQLLCCLLLVVYFVFVIILNV